MKPFLFALKSVCSLLAIATALYLLVIVIAGMNEYSYYHYLWELYSAVGTFSAASLAVAGAICALLVGISVWFQRFRRACAVLAIAAFVLSWFAFVVQPSHSSNCQTELFVLCVDNFWLMKFRYLYSALAITFAMVLAGSALVLQRPSPRP